MGTRQILSTTLALSGVFSVYSFHTRAMSQPPHGAVAAPSPSLHKVKGHTLRLELQCDGLPEGLEGVLRFTVPAEISLVSRKRSDDNVGPTRGAPPGPPGQDGKDDGPPGPQPEKKAKLEDHREGDESSDVELVGVRAAAGLHSAKDQEAVAEPIRQSLSDSKQVDHSSPSEPKAGMAGLHPAPAQPSLAGILLPVPKSSPSGSTQAVQAVPLHTQDATPLLPVEPTPTLIEEVHESQDALSQIENSTQAATNNNLFQVPRPRWSARALDRRAAFELEDGSQDPCSFWP